MRFHLVDRIESIDPGRRIVTTKVLSLAEEYLADHFPTFPVMPGVLMLEVLAQSAAWLVRLHQDFARSIVILAKAKNVRYANFVQPGDVLRCEVDVIEFGPDTARFKGAGAVAGRQAVSARLEMRSFNLADRQKYLAAADAEIVAEMKERFRLIGGPPALAAARPA